MAPSDKGMFQIQVNSKEAMSDNDRFLTIPGKRKPDEKQACHTQEDQWSVTQGGYFHLHG